ncbi:YbhB/YbcL family Raf kinase inhibitor-like protein [Lysobacter olei]
MSLARLLSCVPLVLTTALAATPVGAKEPPMTLRLSSTAFAHEGGMPARLTCDGEDRSPDLHWTGLPAGTRSLALVVDDPDAPDPAAPRMTWVHWVLYNLPATADGLGEGGSRQLPPGTREGVNDWGRTGYGGPCPPVGRHRYFHKLYALDVVLPDLGQPDKARLMKAMEGHILGHTALVGTYQRGR